MLSEFLGDTRAKRVKVAVYTVKISVLGYKGRGGFLPDACDSRHVIDLISHKSEEVNHLFRPDSVFLPYFPHPGHPISHRVDQSHVLGHHLAEVLVSGNQNDL